MNKIITFLFEHKDDTYKNFIARLIPTLPKEYFIGVKVPFIKKLSNLLSQQEKEEFLNQLPHKYYEENLLHGYIISNIKNYETSIEKLNLFLPYANSWAVTDTIRPRCFKKHSKDLIIEVKKWIKSNHTYTVRFAINMLMAYFLDKDFNMSHFDLINSIKSDEYYINIMIAWYYATALSKRWNETIKIIESKTIRKYVQNKAIQKAIESRRINDAQKQYLKTLKIK